MRIIKSFCIAFSMYSQLPTVQFPWKEEDMKYSLCFFPFVGIAIALLLLLWVRAAALLSISSLCFTLIGTVIPILVTGGIHLDGYMDTSDALKSYRDREEKLRILKDPHIGAFSVIMLLLYYLLYMAAFSEIRDFPRIFILMLGFPLSRSLSGLGVLMFPKAKENGSLRSFSDAAEKRIVTWVLELQNVIYMGLMLYSDFRAGSLVILGNLLFFFYYRQKTLKEFGGITGDTAGWFLCLSELITAGVLALEAVLHSLS